MTDLRRVLNMFMSLATILVTYKTLKEFALEAQGKRTGPSQEELLASINAKLARLAPEPATATSDTLDFEDLL